MKRKVYLIPHTHWDAEWYFTHHDSSVLIYNNVFDSMKKLDKKNYKFNWDGQVYPITKFLEYSKNSKIDKYLKESKILIGPWFTQSDSRFVHQEAYYRNLEHGIEVSKKLAHFYPVGLMSDVFGFNAQVPQILQKNGIDNIFFMRGLDISKTKNKNEFTWISPSGHSVYAKQFYNGYGNAKFLSNDMDEFKNRFQPVKNDDLKLSSTNLSVMMHGGDQMYLRDNLDKMIDKINKVDEDEWIVSDLQEYLKEARNRVKNNKIELPEYMGEIKEPIHHRIHLTGYSNRQDINIIRGNLEYKLVNKIEPLNVYSKIAGLTDYSELIYKAWEYLFLSNAHDALVGCNSDSTNSQILNRLEGANQIIDSLENLILKQLSYSKDIKDDQIFVFNNSFEKTNIYKKINVVTQNKNFSLKSNKKIDYFVTNTKEMSSGKRIETTPHGEKEVLLGKYYLSEVLIYIHNVEPFSKVLIELNENNKESKKTICKTKLDNLNIRVETNAGDEFDFSPLKNQYFEDWELDLSKSKVLESNNIKYLKETFYLNTFDDFIERKRKQDLEIDLEIIVWPNNTFQYLLKINNTIMNCRVSIKLDSYKEVKKTISQNIYYNNTNENKKINDRWKEIYREKPINIFAFNGNFSFNKSIFMSKTLREHWFEDNNVFVTLYRSSGQIGKDNLEWRPGRASGVNDQDILTPDAQILKNLEFEFSINKNKKSDIYKSYISDFSYYQKQNSAKHLYRIQRFNIPEQKISLKDITLNKSSNIEITALYLYNNKIRVRILCHQEGQYFIEFNNKKYKGSLKKWEIETIVI